MPLALVSCDDIGNGVSRMWYHWHYHMMPRASTMASLHFFGWDNWNEVWHNYFGHAMPLHQCWHHMMSKALLCDANSIIDGITAFLKSKWPKWGATWIFFHLWHWHHVMPMVASMASLHSLNQNNWNEVHHDFWSCDTIGTSMRWYWQHCQWNHYISYARVIEMRCNMTLIVWCHWHQHHMTPMVLSVTYDTDASTSISTGTKVI